MTSGSHNAGAALWQPQAQMSTAAANRVTIVAGVGSWIETDQGVHLLDATAGLWHANIGHARDRRGRAAAGAARVAAISPIEDAKVFWVSGGSDAIDTAAKLARRFWQLQGQTNKRIIISREWAYHGLHGFGTSIGGIPYNREGYGSESLIPETARVPANDADALEAEILRLGPDRAAAGFAEPIIGTGGVILPAPGYLQRVEQICQEYDVLFVADEVITGFGRTGEMFASSLFDLHPDMVVVAKGITSGYAPLGGVLIGPRVWEPFFAEGGPIFRHGVTYSGHATGCAVAQANLDVLEEEQLVARVAKLAPVLEQTMAPIAKHPHVTEVRTGIGLLAGVQLAPEVDGAAIARACLEAQVVVRIITNNTIQISPPFVIEQDELWRITGAIAAALDHADDLLAAN